MNPPLGFKTLKELLKMNDTDMFIYLYFSYLNSQYRDYIDNELSLINKIRFFKKLRSARKIGAVKEFKLTAHLYPDCLKDICL